MSVESAATATLTSPTPHHATPATVASLGDVNGDGRADFAVGRPRVPSGPFQLRGAVSVVFGGARGPLELGGLGPAGFEVDGPSSPLEEGTPDAPAGAATGASIAPAGDVNGDGLADIVIGSPGATPRNRLHAGAVFVVFGKRDGTRVDLDRLDDGGFRIEGDLPKARVGERVAPAGDVNGDGLSDVAISLVSSTSRRSPQAVAYIVFGRRGTNAVDLRDLGHGGYRILTRRGSPEYAVAQAAGDVNGDRHADTLLAVANFGTFVVFGRAASFDVDLAQLGDGGNELRFRGPAYRTHLTSAGDVNRDGRDDVLVAAMESDVPEDESGAWVVFGRPEAGPVRLDRLGSGGYAIGGGSIGGGTLGVDAANVGDVDGDGRPDAIVAGDWAKNDEPRLHVVFGSSSPRRVVLRRLGRRGFSIDGPLLAADDTLVFEIAAPGDVNGDGRADIAVGGVEHMRACRADLGAAFVVFGRRGGTRVRMSSLAPTDGYVLEGARPGDAVGSIVRDAGDLDGDGRRDLLVGATGEEEEQRFRLHAISTGPRVFPLRTSLPPESCLRAKVLDHSLRRFVRGPGIRVRVALRRLQHDSDVVALTMIDSDPRGRTTARRHPTAPRLPLGSARIRFRRPGVRTAVIRINPFVRRSLLAGRALNARIVAAVVGTDDIRKEIVVRLRD